MTHHDGWADAQDPQLRARLRATDPAADLPPLDGQDLSALLARVTASDPTAADPTAGPDDGDGQADLAGDNGRDAGDELAVRRAARTTGARRGTTPGTTRRRTRTLLGGLVGVAAAGLVAVGGLSVTGGLAASTVELSAGGATAGGPASFCNALTPEALHGSASAFAARAVEVGDGVVRLEVTRTYTGSTIEVGDDVTVPQGDPDVAVIDGGALTYDIGSDYLITTTTGEGSSPTETVTSCGASGPDTPKLRAVYEAAFRD